jgi:hypothetical protein
MEIIFKHDGNGMGVGILSGEWEGMGWKKAFLHTFMLMQ